MDRTAIFIDGGYLAALLRDLGSPRIAFDRLSEQLAAGNSLLRSYYYTCPPFQSNPPTPDEMRRKAGFDGFSRALSNLPRFEVRLGRLAYRGQTAAGDPIFEQKRVDILLGVDLVQLTATRQIQTAVLLAGDSDFLPAVQVAKQSGCLLTLWHGPRGTYSLDLWQECDERFELTPAIINGLHL